jgi:hypothetical protein
MARIPVAYPHDAPRPDTLMRLPEAALQYRRKNGLIRPNYLGSINVTAWLYLDERQKSAVPQICVNPNIPIADLIAEFGPAATRDAEVGIHSEAIAGEWFNKQRDSLRVLAIFSERIPCPKMCAPLLRTYFRGIPWFFYYNRRSWPDKRPSEILQSAYEL